MMTPHQVEQVTREVAGAFRDAVKLKNGRRLTASEGRRFMEWLLTIEGAARDVTGVSRGQ